MSLNRDRKSWCFICGTEIGPRTICDWKNVDTLKGLLVRFCELLPIPGISFQDWDSLIGVPLSVCCRKCYNLLENVGRLHNLIVETQRQLKEHLDEVEKLVTNSEGQGLQCPYWSSSCICFREHILANRKIHVDDKEPDLASEVCVKEEPDCTTGYDDELDNRDWDSEHCNDDREEKYILGDNEPQSDNVNQSVNARHSCIRVRIVTSKESQEESLKSTRSLINKSKVKEKTPAAKKRKIEQEHDSDDSPYAKRRTSPRKAKETAQLALKECSENESQNENDSDDGENDDKDQDYQENEDDDEEEIKQDKASAKEDESSKPVKRSKTKRDPNKFEFHPFIVARENLYLYRFGTFVVRTNTHLQCKAHLCSFQTEFDFDSFPSFQIMRKHIEEKHRTRKHINRTPHSCLVCDIPFKLHADFRNHLRTVHVNQLNNTAGAKAICEICLKPDVPGIKIQSHMMGHKNAEERALARARNEGKQSALRLRESEFSEKPFACDYENCTYAGKSLSNLKRHKRTHLSKEQRPDMVICPECGELIVRDSFKTHTERIHHPELVDSLSILHCPICNKRYHPSQRFVLEKHIRSHKGDKPFLCNECGKSFVGLSNLRGHQKEVHGEHNPVKCEWCDKVFNKYRSMRVHARRHHPEKVGPSICKRKKSKFYYIDAQNKSSPNFIGPRQQFPCPICDTLCKYRVTLKVHMRRFHNPDGQSRERKRQSRKSETISGGDDSSSSVLQTQLPSSSSFLQYGSGPNFASSLTNFPNETNVQDLAARKHY